MIPTCTPPPNTHTPPERCPSRRRQHTIPPCLPAPVCPCTHGGKGAPPACAACISHLVEEEPKVALVRRVPVAPVRHLWLATGGRGGAGAGGTAAPDIGVSDSGRRPGGGATSVCQRPALASVCGAGWSWPAGSLTSSRLFGTLVEMMFTAVLGSPSTLAAARQLSAWSKGVRRERG